MTASPSIVLAIDAGGTYFKSALITHDGDLLDGSFHSDRVDSRGTKTQIISTYETIMRRALDCANAVGMNVAGVGISTPGPFDYRLGISRMKHKFRSIEGVSLAKEIHGMGVFSSEIPVLFMHDVHAFLVGEKWVGAARGIENVAAVTLGTGLGFGMMKHGRIMDNGDGGPIVSIFNRKYKDGSLEDMISRCGIIKQYSAYSGNADDGLDVFDIARKAMSNDTHAIRVFYETGRILGGEISGILDKMDINAVIFGGQISKSFDLFGPAFQEEIALSGRVVRALPGANVDFSALKGAARQIFGIIG